MSSWVFASQLITQKYARSVLHRLRWLISGLASASLMGFFISTMAISFRKNSSKRSSRSKRSSGSFMGARRSFLGFDQPTVSAVAVRMVFRLPAAADGDGFRLLQLQDKGPDAGHRVGAIAEGQVFGARAAAIGDALGDLLDDGGSNEIVVGKRH